MKRIVILASGSGTLAQAIFAVPKDYEVAALICDRAGARVMEIAREFEIEVELLELIGDRSIWNQDIFDLVSKYQPDLIVPYDISLQAQRNSVMSATRNRDRQLGYNPAAQANMAPAEYNAINDA